MDNTSIKRTGKTGNSPYENDLNPYGHQVFKKVTIHQFPHGVEVFLDEAYETWSEPDPYLDDKEKAERGEGDRELSIERSARRAKTKVRRLSKMIEADCMLTLTYRENMQDMKRLQADFKAFRARLATVGAFPYVATIERQKRGAFHLHIACRQFPAYLKNEHGVRVKSYNLIRSMWRRVVGSDNGNVDFTKPRGRNGAHRIASYIAKYVSKCVAEAKLNAKSYWASRDIPPAKKEVMMFPCSMDTFDIVSLLAHDFFQRGYTDIAQFSSGVGQFHWFAASKPA